MSETVSAYGRQDSTSGLSDSTLAYSCLRTTARLTERTVGSELIASRLKIIHVASASSAAEDSR